MSELETRVDAALHGRMPESALRSLVRSLLTEGQSRSQVADLLETYLEHRQPEAQQIEDLVLDYVAVLTGWASDTSVRRLLPAPCVAPHASNLG